MSPPAEAVDQVGAATLERMAAAPRYNRWMFDRLRPWMGRRVLEIGAGIGNMSVFFADRERVVLTDTEPYYLGRLRERFAGRPHVTVAELRLPALSPGLAAERLDSVVCLNVLEHIEDDGAALSAMHQLLQPGGRLVLLVPALRALHGTLDEALGHFNLAGIPGWWLAGRVLRRRLIPSGALRWYDALVPLFRLERLLPWRVGQSLVVPAYNEAATIEAALRRLKQVPLRLEVIAVNDASTDGTGAILDGLAGTGLVQQVLHHPTNRGKGAALRQPIRDGRADAVYGSRFQGGPHRVLLFWHAVGNNLLTLVSNMFTNLNLTDMETGYKLVRADLLKRLPLTAERFGIEVELTARLVQAGARIWELPISYSGRTYAEGKKITWHDGLAALFHIVRYNLLPPRGKWRGR